MIFAIFTIVAMSEMRIWTILQWNIKQNKNIVLPFFSVQTTFRNQKKARGW